MDFFAGYVVGGSMMWLYAFGIPLIRSWWRKKPPPQGDILAKTHFKLTAVPGEKKETR